MELLLLTRSSITEDVVIGLEFSLAFFKVFDNYVRNVFRTISSFEEDNRFVIGNDWGFRRILMLGFFMFWLLVMRFLMVLNRLDVRILVIVFLLLIVENDSDPCTSVLTELFHLFLEGIGILSGEAFEGFGERSHLSYKHEHVLAEVL
jgi:hypothetical protein